MELIDIPLRYFLAGVGAWLVLTIWLVRYPEWIGASVLIFFFLWPATASTYFGGRDVPMGQISMLLFSPALLVTLALKPISVSWNNLALLGTFGLCIVTSIILNDLSLWANKAIVTPVVAAIMIYLSVDSLKALHRMLYAYAALILINTAFAALQQSGFEWAYPEGTSSRGDAGGFVRGFGLAGNFTKASLYASVMIPIAATLLIKCRRPVSLFLAAMLGLLGVIGQVFTVSRSAVLGVAMGLWVVANRGVNTRGIVVGIALVTLILVLVSTVPLVREPAMALYEHLMRFTSEEIAIDQSAALRPEWALEGLRVWLENPVFGNGPGALMRAGSMDPHNTFVNILAQYGVAGMVFFLLILYRCYRSTLRVSRRGYVVEGTALAGALVATLPSAFFHSLDYVELFWFVPALCLAAARFPIRQPAVQHRPAVQARTPYVLVH